MVARDKITFYPDGEVREWYDSLPTHAGSREINRLLKAGLKAEGGGAEAVALVAAVELRKVRSDVDKLVEWKQELPDLAVLEELRDERTDLVELKDSVEELIDWKQELPDFAVLFGELETEEIRDGLKLVVRRKDELENLPELLHTIKSVQEELDQLKQKVQGHVHQPESNLN